MANGTFDDFSFMNMTGTRNLCHYRESERPESSRVMWLTEDIEVDILSKDELNRSTGS